MPETLDYAPTTPAAPRCGRLEYWGMFLLVGTISVLLSQAAAGAYFRERELITLGGTILMSISLLVAGGALAVAHTISPRWFSSARAAALFAASGPPIGIAAFLALASLL